MTKYVFYLRTKEGVIERITHLIAARIEGLMGTYRHEQALKNFPEATVFWENETGPSVGIAPLPSK